MVKRLLLILLFISGAAAGLSAAPLLAQGSGRLDKARRIWTSLSSQDRALVRKNYLRFKAMPAEEQMMIRSRFEIFERLPEKQRQVLLRKWRLFESLEPTQRRKLAQLARKVRRLEPPARAAARRRLDRGEHAGPAGGPPLLRQHGGPRGR